MKFKECEFKNKVNILNTWKWNIMDSVSILFKDEGLHLSTVAVLSYIEYLLEDTDYNHYDNAFYEPISKFKFTVDIFAQITYEYVHEHLSEFKKEM